MVSSSSSEKQVLDTIQVIFVLLAQCLMVYISWFVTNDCAQFFYEAAVVQAVEHLIPPDRISRC